MTATDTLTKEDPVRAATVDALRRVTPAVGELGRALAELLENLPSEHRAEAERVFMNAFGNAVWAEGHRARR